MSKREDTAQELLMTLAIAERESMVLLNLDHSIIKDFLRDKKLYLDHTVESFALVASSPESSEPSFWNKWRLSREPRESLKNEPNHHDYLNIHFIISNLSHSSERILPKIFNQDEFALWKYLVLMVQNNLKVIVMDFWVWIYKNLKVIWKKWAIHKGAAW